MNTLERLARIVKENQPKTLSATRIDAFTSDTCWLDGDMCPYGRPNGKFINRPINFCIVPTGPGTGCSKLFDNVDELNQMTKGHIESEIEKRIDEIVRERSVTLDSELRAAADELESVEKETLVLAADIIEKNKPHHLIVRFDDL